MSNTSMFTHLAPLMWSMRPSREIVIGFMIFAITKVSSSLEEDFALLLELDFSEGSLPLELLDSFLLLEDTSAGFELEDCLVELDDTSVELDAGVADDDELLFTEDEDAVVEEEDASTGLELEEGCWAELDDTSTCLELEDELTLVELLAITLELEDSTGLALELLALTEELLAITLELEDSTGLELEEGCWAELDDTSTCLELEDELTLVELLAITLELDDAGFSTVIFPVIVESSSTPVISMVNSYGKLIASGAIDP